MKSEPAIATIAAGDAPQATYAKLAIGGMRCAACTQIIEFRVKHLTGIERFQINAVTHRAELNWDAEKISLREIVESISELGYSALPAGEHDAQGERRNKLALWRIFIAGFAMMQVMMYAFPAYLQPVPQVDGDLTPDIDRLLKLASLIISVPVVFFSASPFYQSAWRAIRNRHVGMDLPVSIGILVTFGASVWATFRGGPVYFDSAIMFVFLLLGARMIEARVHSKSTAALRALTELVPLVAQRLPRYPASRVSEAVPAAQLAAGDHVLVAPGAQIPADGRVVEGDSESDESLMTGESQPVRKTAGAPLLGGTMNLGGTLVMRAERVGDATQLSSLVRMMEAAANEKPPLVQLADRHASRFMTAILLLSIAAGIAWWLIDPSRALWIAVTVLVVTCPCALSLATPGVMSAAIGQLARRGVLVARGRAIESLARATHFVFDKTGTLTEGRLQLVDTVFLRHTEAGDAALQLASGIAAASLHPVSKALARAAADSGRPLAQNAFTAIREIAGQGVEAVAEDTCYRLGNIDFVQALHGQSLQMPPAFAGKTLATLGDRDGWIAVFALQDAVRADAKACIDYLRAQRKQVLLLSGDRQEVVAEVARALGIEHAQGDLHPQDKHDAVRQLQQRGARVAMVGDGMNDGPVLSLADVSIAMGQGAPISQARSDLVLISNRLRDLQAAVRVSAKSLRLIRENLGWALVYNLIAIPAAMAGILAPWHAAIGMSVSSLLVVLNSLRVFSGGATPADAPQSAE